MLEISFLQALNHIFLNIFIPFFPWLLFLWIFFWNKFKWFFLYLISWFAWFWVVAFSLFNIQFFHFWIWKIEYFLILFSLVFWFFLRLKLKKEIFLDFLNSLKISFSLKFLKEKFLELTKIEKIFFSIWSVFLTLFIWISFAHNLTFPTYFDDSFNNWNKPSINIFYDWWVKLFWEEDEILWHWRFWYPVYLPILKAEIASFVWYWNDIYSNLFQYLTFLFSIFFSILISFKHSRNLFKSILPWIFIAWLPLVYFHAIDWYLEYSTAAYSILTIYFLFSFIKKDDFDFLILWVLFWTILASLKNDWMIVYLPWIIFWFLFILFLQKNFWSFCKKFFMKENFLKSLFLTLYSVVPFLFIRMLYWIWFNPATQEEVIWLSWPHLEIFNYYPYIFFNEDNFNIALVFIILLFFYKKNIENKFVLLSSLIIFLILNAVFLFTENYKWVLDQTTVNRVFTVNLVILLAFFTIIFYGKQEKK